MIQAHTNRLRNEKVFLPELLIYSLPVTHRLSITDLNKHCDTGSICLKYAYQGHGKCHVYMVNAYILVGKT